MKKPFHQKVIIWMTCLLAGFIGVGTLLDSVSNAITLVTGTLTRVGSLIILILYLSAQIFLRVRPLRWAVEGGKEVRLKRLGWRVTLAVAGAVLLLWVPRLTETVRRDAPPAASETVGQPEGLIADAAEPRGGARGAVGPAPAAAAPPELKLDMLQKGDITRFAIVSSGLGQFVVNRLFVKLRGYADCSLRNEESTLGMVVIPNYYLLYISPESSEYDLLPYTSPGDAGVWKYTGEDVELFSVEFWYRDYTLFILSVEAVGKDLKSGRDVHLSSEPIELISVARGNMGGCLDLEDWFRPELIKKPKQQLYGKGLPLLVRQLLTVDLDNSSLLDKLGRDKLKALLPQLEKARRMNKDNRAFDMNVTRVRRFLSEGGGQK
jgi:hypothetical protein